MPYIIPDNVADYLNKDFTADGESLVTDLIAGAQDALERACNRVWSDGAPHTETFDAGSLSLFPKQVPLDSVVSLTLDGSPLTEDVNFFVYKSYIKTYTASDSVPAAIKQALVRWAAEQFIDSIKSIDQTVKRLTQGPVTVEYSATNSQTCSSGVPTYVEEVVRQYRLPAM